MNLKVLVDALISDNIIIKVKENKLILEFDKFIYYVQIHIIYIESLDLK